MRPPSKAIIIPKAMVAKFGNGDLQAGTEFLDGFMDHNGTTIDWPDSEAADGDYILRQQDLRRCGKGCEKRGLRLRDR